MKANLLITLHWK